MIFKRIFYILPVLFIIGGIWISGSGRIKDSYIKLTSPDKNQVEYGDIISFSNIQTGKIRDLKRVIGLPGDTVMIKNGLLYRNNQILDEPYILNGLPTYGNTFLSECILYTVLLNSYLVLGDNRTISQDSRVLGFINKKDIIGVIKTHIIPKYLSNLPDNRKDRSLMDPVKLFSKINDFRTENNLNPLFLDPTLKDLASYRALEIKNHLKNNLVFTDIDQSARNAGYENFSIHEFIVYGSLMEAEVTGQISEIRAEKDAFLSSSYTNMAIGESQKSDNECVASITVILISWPKIPVYDPRVTDKWKNAEISTTQLIKSVQSLTGNAKIDQTILNKLITSLIKQSEISSRIYRKMSTRELLNDLDNQDIQYYPNIVKQTNQMIEEIMVKPNNSPKVQSKNFNTYGVSQIEPGILADITNLSVNNYTIEATIILINNTQSQTIFSPLRFQILTNSQSGSITSSLSEIKLSPLTSQTYKFNFDLLPDPPYRFIYLNSNGDTTDLATLKK